LLATVTLLGASLVHAQVGIQPIPDQDIPSGKTVVVPIPATDPDGPARSYTVTTGSMTVTTGTTTVSATAAGIVATIRTGDPHFTVGVTYTDGTGAMQTGTMEFQMLREFSPIATQFISGLTEGGFYNPTTGTSGKISYVPFHRVVPGFVIQGGDPSGTGTGGPGFTFKSEYSSALIYSASAGQLAMANSNGANPLLNGQSNGSQFFVTLASQRVALDYGYTIFGHLLRGYDTLTGIASTPVEDNGSGEVSKPVNPVDITSATMTTNNTDAVLFLSGTGVCDGPVTVTATPLTGTDAAVTGTFTAHLQADTISDPPFLQPPPNIAVPNGTAKVPITATDLQLDLIRYGWERLEPFADPVITSGTSPVLSIPLVKNSDNLIGAKVDSWTASQRGYINFNFHALAGFPALTGTLAPIAASRTGDSVKVTLTFAGGTAKDTVKSFAGTVNWGDDTLTSGTTIEFSKVKLAPKKNGFQMTASHIYKDAGEYPVVVGVADRNLAQLTLTGTANVSVSQIAMSGVDIANTGGVIANQVVANFDDMAPTSGTGYTATINWGDGVVSSGTVASTGTSGSTFQVQGGHVYGTAATYTVSTLVTRSGTNGAMSAWTWATTQTTGTGGPQVLPPFPQAHLAQKWSAIVSSSDPVLADGANPYAVLATGTDGNYYGTTYAGSGSNAGTVYQLIETGSTAGTVNTLYTFTGGSDGGNPYAGLVLGADGNFYGTTVTGGTDGDGTVYRVGVSGTQATLESLFSFSKEGRDYPDGRNPYGTLVQGTSGELYGTTYAGGTHGFGTVFGITTSGSVASVYSFTGGTDGGNPIAGLTAGTDGNYYGTTSAGGGRGKEGTVFRITPDGTLTTLYAFTSGSDGGRPFGPLLASGTDFYGTTDVGGGGSAGTVFEITTSGSLTTLYSFTGGSDGGNPRGGLTTGTGGSLYGATTTSGTSGAGTVFQLFTTGTAAPSLTTLYTFTGGNDGGVPYAAPVTGTDGNLYGTTETDGSAGAGTVYQLVESGSTAGTLNTLHSFLGNSPVTTGLPFQISVSGTVQIINTGNVTSQPGSFSVYVDPNGALDGQQTIFTSNGQSSFAIPALVSGSSITFSFTKQGGIDGRLKLPVGTNPTAQQIIGVVKYSDPVGDYDGALKIISPGSF